MTLIARPSRVTKGAKRAWAGVSPALPGASVLLAPPGIAGLVVVLLALGPFRTGRCVLRWFRRSVPVTALSLLCPLLVRTVLLLAAVPLLLLVSPPVAGRNRLSSRVRPRVRSSADPPPASPRPVAPSPLLPASAVVESSVPAKLEILFLTKAQELLIAPLAAK